MPAASRVLTTEQAAEVARLKRENAELRRANETLKEQQLSSRPSSTVPRNGDHVYHRTQGPPYPLAAGDIAGGQGLRWGVEPMCAVLTEHGIKIGSATYYEWANAKPTRRELRDAEILGLLVAERTHPKTGKLAATLGSRKMWIRLRGKGHDVARCTVERLMREQGWEGTRYGSKVHTTVANQDHPRAPDLVDRDFNPLAPNRLWVADIKCRRRHRTRRTSRPHRWRC